MIYTGLVNRRSRTDYPNLNIWLFFNLVYRLNEENYYRLISPIFTFGLKDICKSIKKILEKCDSKGLEIDNYYSLLELLLCLSPIPAHSPKSSSMDVFFKIADKNMKLSVEILEKYVENQTSLISQTLLTVLLSNCKDIIQR